MDVTIFGTGYLGLVTGACMAEMGNKVVCIDMNAEKVAQLTQGDIPIFEGTWSRWSSATIPKVPRSSPTTQRQQ